MTFFQDEGLPPSRLRVGPHEQGCQQLPVQEPSSLAAVCKQRAKYHLVLIEVLGSPSFPDSPAEGPRYKA